MKIGKFKIKTWQIIVAIVALVIIFMLFRSCSNMSGINYKEETAQARNITTYYSFSGNIDAEDKQNMVSTNALTIDKIYVNEGDSVRIGQPLYKLDTSDIVNNVSQAQASVEIASVAYEQAQTSGRDQTITQATSNFSQAQQAFSDAHTNLDRLTTLYNNGAITLAELQQAQSTFNNAQSQLNSAQVAYDSASTTASQNIRTAKAQLDQANAALSSAKDALSDRTITAKVNGIVSEIYAKENQVLKINDQIMDVVDYNSLVLKAKIDEYEIPSLSIGKVVDVYIDAFDKNVAGTVTKISDQATTEGDLSYFIATIKLDADADLKIGLSVEAKVPNDVSENVVSLTSNAISYEKTSKPFVYVKSGDKMLKRTVEVGNTDGEYVEIVSGVENGETVYIPRILSEQEEEMVEIHNNFEDASEDSEN
ncbi:MAG: efflux RND transporter periplasmic adaptor subunit [Clostridiales bacterium]|jgi:HlyD family secretion protein|nr:efflux RND transporter periplasmic adaptor subunit [Clostridiales bacterium]